MSPLVVINPSSSSYSTLSSRRVLCFIFGFPKGLSWCSVNIWWKDNAVDERMPQSRERTAIGVRMSGFHVNELCDLWQDTCHPRVSVSVFLKTEKLVWITITFFILEIYDSRVLWAGLSSISINLPARSRNPHPLPHWIWVGNYSDYSFAKAGKRACQGK